MEDLQEVLDDLGKTPSGLADMVVRYETWEKEAVGWLTEDKAAEEESPLRLYHPAHGRFYLVAASLVCRKPGLPDKCLDTGKQEKVRFVIRRIVDNIEYAWVPEEARQLFTLDSSYEDNLNNTSTGWREQFRVEKYPVPASALIYAGTSGRRWAIKDTAGQYLYSIYKEDNKLNVYKGVKKGWHEAPGTVILTDEERLPMFSAHFTDRDRQRRLLAGYIPAANSETYKVPAKKSPFILSAEDLQDPLYSGDPFLDPRRVQYETTVQEAAKELEERAKITGNVMTAQEAREVLVFICLDFAEFLQQHLPDVWNAIDNEASSWPGSSGDEENLFDWLHSDTFFHGTDRWDAVLKSVNDKRNDILTGTLKDPGSEFDAIKSLTLTEVKNIAGDLKNIEPPDSPGTMETKVIDALGDYEAAEPGAGEEDGQEASEVPGASRYETGVYYVIRCVYERPQCKGIHSPVVSSPSREFQLASFFEPEAPTRPIRITMPADTSIAGLRKFKKNVSMLISKKLRSQIERMQGVSLQDVDDGNIPEEPGFNLGMICSLSIPIITICALILLMIILQLLNIVFWWLPFFKICFPKK